MFFMANRNIVSALIRLRQLNQDEETFQQVPPGQFSGLAVLRTSDAERSEDASVTQHPHVPPLRKDRLPR